jgi:hypothetical protein
MCEACTVPFTGFDREEKECRGSALARSCRMPRDQPPGLRHSMARTLKLRVKQCIQGFHALSSGTLLQNVDLRDLDV